MRSVSLIIWMALLGQAPLQAMQEGRNYTVRHYTSENGLPQNSVGSIALDQEGFIWLATNAGLVRFDGQSFNIADKTRLGLQTNIFQGFLQDTHRLYALTEKFEYAEIIDGKATRNTNLPIARLREMFQTKEGPRELAYAMDFPYRFSETWFPSRTASTSHEKWFPSHYVFLIPNSDGDFFKWQKDGKVDYYSKWKKQKSFLTQVRVPQGIFRVGKYLYNDDRAGNIELLATGNGPNEKRDKTRLENTQRKQPLSDLAKSYIVYSHNLSGEAFIYQDLKLYRLSHNENGDLETTILLDGFDFERNNVISVLFDEKHQRLYLGTLNKGLFILDFHQFEALAIDSNEASANIYYAQTTFTDSTVITPSFKVMGKAADGRTLAYQLIPPTRDFPMTWKSILKARSGDIWCLKSNMLYRFDGNGKKLKKQWDAGSEISHLSEDTQGRIWLGTRFAGLMYVDVNEPGTPVHVFTQKIKAITYMMSEGPEILWVGTGTGLFKVNLVRKTFSLIPGTGKFYVKSLLMPFNGELWFTTYDHGLFLLQNNRLTKLPLDKNRILQNAHCLVYDKNDFLWIPTNNGLFRVYRKDLLDFTAHQDSTRIYYHRYSKRDGFRIDEFNGGCQPCAVRLSNGYVSLPSIDGLIFFKPEQTPVDVPDSKIFIDRMESNAQNVAFDGTRIRLPGTATDLKVFISSPYLGNRENQQLSYSVSSNRRDESQQIWYPIEHEQQFLLLNNLESGTYTLKIRKIAGFGPDSERLTAFTIIIPYAWYETWPFKALALLLAAIAFYLYFKNRLKKADRLNRILAYRVAEKTHSLQDTLSVLKTSEQELLKQTRLQMHLIASISHDIRSPLRSIEFTSARIDSLIDSGDYSLAKTVGMSVNESSRKILSLLENMLIYVKSQVSGTAVTNEIFTARALVEDVAHIFKDTFLIHGNEFKNQVPETLLLRSNRQLLKIILHNLLDNANKFISESTVIVSARKEGGMITLVVSDTGPGLPNDILDWFNSVDIAFPESPVEEPVVKGIGLLIVRELADMLGVQIRASNEHGAQFHLRFVEPV